MRYKISVLIALLFVGGFAVASESDDSWREDLTRIRLLTENDASQAYSQVMELQENMNMISSQTTADRVKLYNLISRIDIYLANLDKAKTLADEALTLARDNSDKDGQAEAELNLIWIFLNQGKLDDMYKSVEKSQELLKGSDRADLYGESLLQTALMYRRKGLLDEALSLTLKFLAMADNSPNPLVKSYAFKAMGTQFLQSKKISEAELYFEKMRDAAKQVPSLELEADALVNLASIANSRKNWEKGETYAREAIRDYRISGNPLGLNLALYGLASNLDQQGKYDEAIPLLDEVVRIYGQHPNPIALWYTLRFRGDIYMKLEKDGPALSDYTQAYKLAGDTGISKLRSESAAKLADFAESRGEYKEAYAYLSESVQISSKAMEESDARRTDKLVSQYKKEIDKLTQSNKEQATKIHKIRIKQYFMFYGLIAAGLNSLIIIYFSLRMRKMNRKLYRSKSDLQSIIEALPDFLYDLGPDGEYHSHFSSRDRHLLAPPDGFSGTHLADFLPSDVADAYGSALMDAEESGHSSGRQFAIDHSMGRDWFELSVSRKRTKNGSSSRFIALSRNITERMEADEKIRQMAHFDELTGLPNRSLLRDRIEMALAAAERHEKLLSILFLDFDKFKEINDLYGHQVGDRFLVEMSAIMKTALRNLDTLARFGGDEFLLMLPDTDGDGAAKVVEKLLLAVSQNCRIGDLELSATFSVGIAVYPHDGKDYDELVKNADIAMYHAKASGRNRFSFFSTGMQTLSEKGLQLGGALRQALRLGEFSLHYQPQVSMAGKSVVGVEALLRWNNHSWGSITPAEFVPLLEESGQILEVGEWVLRTAVTQLRAWMDMGMDSLVMAVNISFAQFREAGLPELVSRILEENDVPPSRLELELTESVAVSNPDFVISVVDNFHDRGIRISIDDFGTGYSSLSSLKRFKIDKLKIDRGFVWDLSSDENGRAIIDTIISLAENLGLTIIAEGVETEEQLEYLDERGCHEIQGYYFSKPLPPEQFESFYSDFTYSAKMTGSK